MAVNEEMLDKLNKAMSGIRDDMLYVVEINLEDDTYITLLSNLESLDIYVPAEGKYSDLNAELMQYIAKEHQEMRSRYGDVAFLSKILSKEKRSELEYIVEKDTNTWRRDLFFVTEYVDDKPVKVVWLHRTIDQAKAELLRQSQALIEAQAVAETANQARNEFLKRMKQDIRTPMNTIVGMTAVASAYVTDPERVQVCLDTIASTAKDMFTTFKNIMHMLNIEAGSVKLESQPFVLGKLLEEGLHLVFEDSKRKGHHITMDFSNLSDQIMIGDPGRIQQVFVEVLRNAVLYTPSNGNIKISAKELEQKNVKTKTFEIVVDDDGVGMSEEFLKIIFEPYAREQMHGSEHTNGSGLGLVIARNITRMMDGDICITSKRGQGTTVRIQFKCQIATEQNTKNLQDKLASFTNLTSPYAGAHVMIVDENELSAEIVKKILLSQGVQVDWARNGVESVQKIEQSEEHYYDIVFMDLVMQKMDGFEATTAIRNLNREDVKTIPIVAVSLSIQPEDRVHAMLADMDDYIQKSMDYSQYITMLEKYI